MLKIYKEYKKAGLACLPVRRDKTPLAPWKGGIDNEQLYAGAEGIAVAAGSPSGNVECLDIDNHFGDAKKTLSDFMLIEDVMEIHKRVGLVVNRTQSGGYHILYRLPGKPGGNKKLAQKPKWDIKRGKYVPDTTLETRGEDGYFLVPPTPGYVTLRGEMLHIPIITEMDHEVLMTAARSFNQWVEEDRAPRRGSGAGERPGDLYDNDPLSVYEAKEALAGAGWVELKNKRWRRPGKDKGISATFGVVAENVFYVFSSNAHPFNEMSGYTPFQVVGLLKYDGDFSEFAKVLSERYKQPEARHNIADPVEQDRKVSEMEQLLADAFVDVDVPPPKPPVVMMVRNSTYTDWQRLFTLGNFSAITGKAKARKTFLTTMISAAAAGNGPIYGKLKGHLPVSKSTVIRFDTEQSDYDAYVASKRTVDMIPFSDVQNFAAFTLREHNPLKRCEIIEYTLNKFKDSIGIAIIDGIADLATAINDEEEATRVSSLLLKWTKVYNCHIVVVIHQNKGNAFATGHLGSSVMKKAEAVIQVNKEEENGDVSQVECELIRGVRDFDEFRFFIDDQGFPVVLGKDGINSTREGMNKDEW